MKLLVVSPSPVGQYKEQGNLRAFVDLHNPNGMFDEVHVIQTTTPNGGNFRLSDEFFVHRTRWPQWGGPFGTLIKAIGLLVVLCRGIFLVRREEIDLIRGQGIVPAGVLALVLKWTTGVPNITSIHTDFDKIKKVKRQYDVFGSRLLTRAFERVVIRRSSAIFVLTPYLREMMIRRGAAEENVYVTPNHIRREIFSPPSADEQSKKRAELGLNDGFTFLFVGRLVDAKDPMTLLEGFRTAKTECPEIQLVVVGDGEYRPDMERYVAEHGLEDDVVFTGFVSRTEVASIMGAADSLVHPSLFEGFGFVYIEAQATGLPIVTTDIPHVKSIVNRENAFIYPPGDARALGEQLVTVTVDERRRKEMIQRGYETVERFETARQHDRHEAALRSVVTG